MVTEVVGRAEIVCPAQPPEPPVPGIELSKVAGEATVTAPGEFAVPITLTVTNTGNEAVIGVQIEDLLELFGPTGRLIGVTDLSGSGLTVNSGFDGSSESEILAGTDRLDAGASGSATFTVEFASGDERGPFVNMATGTAMGERSGTGVSETAEATITLPAPMLSADIQLVAVAGTVEASGTGTFTVPITLTVTNTGTDALVAVQLQELLEIFGPSGQLVAVTGLSGSGLTVDPSFDGSTQTSLLAGTDGLLPGASGSVTFTVEFDPGAEPGPFTSTPRVTGTGETSGTDVSDTAELPISVPTPEPAPAIALTMALGDVVSSGDRHLHGRGHADGPEYG